MSKETVVVKGDKVEITSYQTRVVDKAVRIKQLDRQIELVENRLKDLKAERSKLK